MNFETNCVRGGYSPKSGDSVVMPIVSSTTYRYDTTEEVNELFDLEREGYFYSRIENPTVSAVEKHIAQLESDDSDKSAALMTSSGQSANLFAVLNICSAGDHIICARSVYGGTVNLFQHRLSTLGIEVTFIDNDSSYEQICSSIKKNTKLLFGETLSNPLLVVLDIDVWAKAANDNNIPLIIDNTFATPYFCKPLQFGANIVTHSSTKYLDGHALQVSGIIVDGGNFNWENAYSKTGHFGQLVEPDETYKGISYTKHFKEKAYITKARVQLMRDLGCTPSPFNAFLLNNGVQTLHLRMKQHFENALKVAQFLESHPKIKKVNFPGLKSNEYYNVAKKYMPLGTSGVLSFEVNSGNNDARQCAADVINAFRLINIEVNVAEIRSCALHPASSTHRQMSDEELINSGISSGLIRLSVGLESVEDIIEDLERSLK